MKRTAGFRRELRNELIAARNGKPPWSKKAFIRIVCGTENCNVVRCRNFAREFPDMHPRKWPKQALITAKEATEAYMVEVTADFHC